MGTMAASRAKNFKNTAAKTTQPKRDARRCFIIISGTTIDTADVRVDGESFDAGRGHEREHALLVLLVPAIRSEIVQRQETALPPVRCGRGRLDGGCLLARVGRPGAIIIKIIIIIIIRRTPGAGLVRSRASKLVSFLAS